LLVDADIALAPCVVTDNIKLRKKEKCWRVEVSYKIPKVRDKQKPINVEFLGANLWPF
jgi:hypothetical protein